MQKCWQKFNMDFLVLFVVITFRHHFTPVFLESVVVLIYYLSVLLHFLQSVWLRFILDCVDRLRDWRVRWTREGSSFFLRVAERGGRFVVFIYCFFGSFISILLVLMIGKLNGCFGNSSIMPVTVFHAYMKSQSGGELTVISPAASVVTSTGPSYLGRIFVSLTTRISDGWLRASWATKLFATMSPFCLFLFRFSSVSITVAAIGTGTKL